MNTEPRTALLLSAVLFVSYGYWHYSLQAEPHILATLFLILFLSRLWRFLKFPTASHGAAVGAFLGLATLMHQSNVLLAPIVLMGGAFSRAARVSLTTFCAVFCGFVIPPYLGVGWTLLGLRSVHDFRDWILGLSLWGPWGHWNLTSSVQAAVGSARCLAGSHFLLGIRPVERFAQRMFPRASWGDEMAVASSVSEGLCYALAAIEVGILAGAVMAIVWWLRKLFRMFSVERGFAVCLLTWIAVLTLFFTWWAPVRVEFWIAPFLPILVVLGYPLPQGAMKGQTRRWLWSAFALGLFVVNFCGSIRPQSMASLEPETAAAMAIEAVVEPGSIVVSDAGFCGRTSKYVISFERIDLVSRCCSVISDGESLHQREPGPSGDPPATGITGNRLVEEDLGMRACRLVDSLLTDSDPRGRSLYLLASPVSSDRGRALLYERLVAAVGERYDISETVPVRAAVNMRSLKRR